MRARLGENYLQNKKRVAQVALRRSLDKIDNNEAKSQDESWVIISIEWYEFDEAQWFYTPKWCSHLESKEGYAGFPAYLLYKTFMHSKEYIWYSRIFFAVIDGFNC